MTFSISVEDSGTTRIAIAGGLDIVSVTDLRTAIEKLLADKPARVEVDLSALRLLDSSGVGALVSLYKRVRAQGGQVVVSGLRDQPLAIFRLLRLDRVMVGAEVLTQKAST
jgi:anti-sigma B factor antagonist